MFLVDALDHGLAIVSEQSGLSLANIRFTSALFVLFFVAHLFRLVRSEESRKNFSVVLGVFVLWFAFRRGCVHALASAVANYVVLLAVPRRVAGYWALAASFAHLLWMHLYVFLYSPDIMFDAAHMVVVLRTSSVGFNYSDGAVPRKQLTTRQAETALAELPSFRDYCAYVLFFPSILAGPFFEFTHFLEFMRCKTPEPEVRRGVWTLLFGILCLAGFVVSMVYVPAQYMTTPEFLYGERFSFWSRNAYLWLCVSLVRFKYYFVWKVAEATCLAAGLGYGGRDSEGNAKWDAMSNVDVLQVELPENFRQVTTYWNKGTNRWLKSYVYDRTPTSSRVFLTYMTSAVWHGFFAGYYVTFGLGALMTQAGRKCRRFLRPLFIESPLWKSVYDIVGIITTSICLQNMAVSFELRTVGNIVRVFGSVYCAVPAIALSWVLLPWERLLPRATVGKTDKKNE